MNDHDHDHDRQTLARQIRNQAAGYRPTEVAAMIATQARNGRLAALASPWTTIDHDADMAWIDWRAAQADAVGISSGERSLIALAGSLATWGSDAITVNLADTLTGLDDTNGLVVVRAVAHALDIPSVLR